MFVTPWFILFNITHETANPLITEFVQHTGNILPPWSLLLIFCARLACWFWQNLPLTNEYNMSTTEFLFQFTHQTCLYFLERLQLRNWYINDD